MKGPLKTTLIFLLITLALSAEYSTFPFTIEAEDCEEAGEPWTSIYGQVIKGMFSGKGFVYLTNNPFSFDLTVPEDGMYQFNAKIAQMLDQNGRP